MSIDLRNPDHRRTCFTWVRRFGEHEEQGLHVSVNDESAHVTLVDIGALFEIDREDLPAAFERPIDPVKLRAELEEVICRRLTPETLRALLREVRDEIWRTHQRTKEETDYAAKARLREALGL